MAWKQKSTNFREKEREKEVEREKRKKGDNQL